MSYRTMPPSALLATVLLAVGAGATAQARPTPTPTEEVVVDESRLPPGWEIYDRVNRGEAPERLRVSTSTAVQPSPGRTGVPGCAPSPSRSGSSRRGR